MSDTTSIDAILVAGNRKEKNYDWLGAVEVYSAGFSSVSSHDFSTLGRLHECLGYVFRRAAMQADNVAEFRTRLDKSVLNYDKSREAYGKIRGDDAINHAKALRCDAATAYVGHWLAVDSSEKKRLLDDCWKLVLESMGLFEKEGELDEYVKTYIELSDAAIFLFTREFDFKSREKAIQEAIDCGEKAIKFLSQSKDAAALTLIYARMVVFLAVFSYYLKDIDEREKYRQQGLSYWARLDSSHEIVLRESVYPVFGGNVFFGLEGSDQAFENYRRTLEHGRKVNDKFIIGCALDWIAYHVAWKIEATDDPERKRTLIDECVRWAQESSKEFDKLPFVSPRADHAWSRAIEFERLFWLSGMETDLGKRRELTEEAFHWLQNNRGVFDESGYPEVLVFWHNCASVIRQRLAELETNAVDKKSSLEKTLREFNERLKIEEKIEPLLYWNIGIVRKSLGNTQYQLAAVTENPEEKKTLLEEAIINEEKGIELCLKELSYFTKDGSAPCKMATWSAF